MAKSEFPRLAEKEFLVLRLLVSNAGKRMYGLELVDKSNGALKRGTIYVTLARLEEKGFVQSEKEPEDPNLASPRRLYKTTGEGARVYRAVESITGRGWLKEQMA